MFVHHGAIVWSRITGCDELAGSEVIVAHRLRKGVGTAEALANGFALLTAAAVEALGLEADRSVVWVRSGRLGAFRWIDQQDDIVPSHRPVSIRESFNLFGGD